MQTPNIRAGIDIGNGYTKGRLSSSVDGFTRMNIIDIPSSVTMVTRPNDTPDPDSLAYEKLTSFTGPARPLDIMESLDASFDTPLVENKYRRLFGQRALSARGSFVEFSVTGNLSKAQQSLSHILVLGSLAAKAAADTALVLGAATPLPSELEVSVEVLALALPINEYRKFRQNYIDALSTGIHRVSINNFETPITLSIDIQKVVVLPEGTSAQFAIRTLNASAMEMMLADVRARGIEVDGSGEDVLAASSIIGVDVGEGTVNFPVFTNGDYNNDASGTLGSGFGTVLTNALERMDNEGFAAGFTSRKQLADYLTRAPSPMRRKHFEKVASYVGEEAGFFADEVAEHFGRILQVVGGSTEVVYVYGGGASNAVETISLKTFLYSKLIAKVKEYLGMDAFPVLYLDASFSRDLNREGLYQAAIA